MVLFWDRAITKIKIVRNSWVAMCLGFSNRGMRCAHGWAEQIAASPGPNLGAGQGAGRPRDFLSRHRFVLRGDLQDVV